MNKRIIQIMAWSALLLLTGCAGVYGTLVMRRPDGSEVSCQRPGVVYVGLSGGSDEQVVRVIEERECVREMAAKGYVCESDLCRRMAGSPPSWPKEAR